MYSSIYFAVSYPIAIDTINVKPIYKVNKGNNVKAGPGHKPEIPQPTPNKKAPKHNLQSIVLF